MPTIHLLIKSNRIADRLETKLSPIGYSLIRLADEAAATAALETSPQVLVVEVFEKAEATLSFVRKAIERSPECQLIVLYSAQSLIDLSEVLGEGAFAAFQIPFEEDRIVSSIIEASPLHISTEKITLDCLQRVVLAEMDPETPLEFDLFIHLQANKKLFLYRQKNHVLSKTQFEKFQKKQFNQLYVRKTELSKFREFTSKRMKQIYQSGWVSETERVELLQKEVRALLSPLFDSSDLSSAESKEILENCKQVVADFIVNVVPNPELYKQLLALGAQNHGNLQHAVNVSAYTSLFALALGYSDVEAAALGGLLHDIGLSTLRPELAALKPEQMSTEEYEEFKQHIPAAIEILQKKKMPAADTVISIVQQHHEFADGSGFPLGLKQPDIHPLARICAIADEFDALTSLREDSPSLSPQAAINYLAAYNSMTSVPQKLDHEMVVKLVAILQVPETKIDMTVFQDILKSRMAESGLGLDDVPLNEIESQMNTSNAANEDNLSSVEECPSQEGLTDEELALIMTDKKEAA